MAANPFLWSITASDNDDADPAVPWPEGMFPGAVNNSARSVMEGIARYIADTNGTLTTGGSADAYTVTTNCPHTTYTNGILVTAKASFSNTALCSLNLNAFGAKAIRVMTASGEGDPVAGQIKSGGTYQFRYDSAAASASGAFILLNPSPDFTAQLSVGNIKISSKVSVPEDGWLFCNGQTIGDASSGATALASSLAVQLFFYLYNNFADSEAPVSGGRTGGGASADFAAHKTIQLPDLCGRAPFGADNMGGITLKGRITNAGSGIVGTTIGASGGAETVTLSTTQVPSHTHTGTTTTTGSDHTHAGTTGAENSVHTHTGTTGTESATHAHTFSGTTSGQSADHTHTQDGSTGLAASVAATSATGYVAVANKQTGGTSNDHTHTYSGTTGTENATHTHTVTTGTESAVHTHDFLIGSSGGHTHTFTTGSTGGGLAHSNMPPAYITNYIIKY